MRYSRFAGLAMVAAMVLASPGLTSQVSAQAPPEAEYPPLEKVTEGFTKVVSTTDGKKSFYTLWINPKTNQMLAELPKDFARQRHFIALTVSSGNVFAGLQSGDMYVYWRQYNKRLAMIAPNIEIRSTGDEESKSSVSRLFTDQVLTDVPILTMVPRGGPVIDLDALLVGQANVFFGASARTSRPQLAKIAKSKAFPSNVEVAFEVPATNGNLQTLHYSFSLIPDSTGYKPRAADERIGYFTTSYSDFGKYTDDETRTRYINRWNLEKRDPSLAVSPPKKPIVFYLEHTTPVRYRRWVREGVDYWNKAFENVGISNAIEVYYQDKQTGAYMDLDPEDVRYNFIRWLNNDISTAIGPSRVHPLTGQILDADIVLTDGWIRTFETQFAEVMPKLAMEGMNADTLAWLADHPNWDPRVRMAPPSERFAIMQRLQEQSRKPYSGHEMENLETKLLGDDPFDGLVGRTSQVNGMCLAADAKSYDVAVLRMMIAMAEGLQDDKDEDKEDEDKEDEDKEGEEGDEDKEEEKKEEPKLDGMPESFIGPLLADLVAHEVGHTLGLRHNFKASSVYTLAEMNSEELKGKTPFAGSVMDYLPVNFYMETGEVQGDYAMIGVGPYDMWAIEYGYTFDKDLDKILQRVAEPELTYATDEDTGGPDPLARRYDFSKDPLDYAQEQIRIAEYNRGRVLEHFVKEGDSWAKARQGYELTLSLQTRATSMMSNWVGGTFVHRDKKGDEDGRAPIETVPAETQRKALKFVIEHTFRDENYGLTPELLSYMTVDKWIDDGNSARTDPTWPVHDRIMSIQASTMTQLLNPTRLGYVYDNEFRTPADQDAVTLPEMLSTVGDEVWSELDGDASGTYTARSPMISSLRRNLQREHLERLIDLMMDNGLSTAASKPISNLAMMELKDLGGKIDGVLESSGDKLDAYTKAHLNEASMRIEKALDADFVYSPSSGGLIGRLIGGRTATEGNGDR